MRNSVNKLWVMLTMALIVTAGFSQGLDLPFGNTDFDPKTEITHEIGSLPSEVRTGEAIRFQMTVHVPRGYHITKELFSFKSENGSFVVAQLDMPKGKKNILGEVLGGDIPVQVTIVPKKAGVPLKYSLTYQACSEGENPVCFPPSTVHGKLALKATGEATTLADRLSGALGSSMLLALLLVFLGGIGASLTPCVYPVIPLTVAYVGARSEGNRLKGFILSIMLVLGIATTYSALGIVSAKTGAAFGSVTQHPVFVITLALVFVAMGLSMFGYYDIQLPASVNTKLQVQRKGLLGAYLMGMATGVLAAPCVGPIIVVLLGWVAQTGSMFKGFIYLFVFALGMGMLFILIGTFSGILASLPKAGNWMITVKYVFGILFMIAAVLFARPVLGDYLTPAVVVSLIPLFLALAAKSRVGKGTGLVFLVVIAAGLIAVQQMETKDESGGATDYQPALQQALATAGKEHRIVILDFYADWCAACKELDEYTWSNPQVKQTLDRTAILVKMDFTTVTGKGKAFQERFKVVGLPTVVFLDSKGKELGRFVGFVKPRPFLKKLQGMITRTGMTAHAPEGTKGSPEPSSPDEQSN